MSGLLTNGTYVLVPEQDPDYEKLYDYAMFDDNGHLVAGVKHGPDGLDYVGALKKNAATELRIYNDKATQASAMFQNCSALRSIPANSFNSVSAAPYMFDQCKSLTAIPENSFSSVVNADRMFQSCSSLRSIPANSFNTVTAGSYTFASAYSLTSIGENCLTNLTSGGNNLFTNCSALAELPDNFLNKVSGNSIGNFAECYSLTSIPKNSFNNFSAIGTNCFSNCRSLVDISNLTSCYANAKSAATGTSGPFIGCSAVTSNLIPIIDYFRTKTPPLSAGSAHLFSACNKAADYATCTASPVYSGWVK